MVRSTHRLILGILIVLVVALFIAETVRPNQQEIDETVLALKDTDNEAYLDFIANNLIGGGPPKDGIPAIDKPRYITPEEAELDGSLSEEDQIFGINYGGLTIAAPQDIMYWHEILNEKTGSGEMLSVTYCPLTGSVIGYKDNLGVSGKLYNSNLVLYDRETDSYWPQILGKAVTGERKGESLETFPVVVTTWKKWKSKYPNTLVLSRQTGFDRDYDRNPYPGYDNALRVWFPTAASSNLYPSKKTVHGIVHGDKALAVIKENLHEPLQYEDLSIALDPELGVITVVDENGKEPSHFDVYWFAWYAYHPETEVINP